MFSNPTCLSNDDPFTLFQAPYAYAYIYIYMCVYMYIHTYYVKAGSILVGGLVRDIGQDSYRVHGSVLGVDSHPHQQLIFETLHLLSCTSHVNKKIQKMHLGTKVSQVTVLIRLDGYVQRQFLMVTTTRQQRKLMTFLLRR